MPSWPCGPFTTTDGRDKQTISFSATFKIMPPIAATLLGDKKKMTGKSNEFN
jgi:hypothetical protein